MDFGIIYQLKTKKFWWLDTIFYFVIALLLATIICFFIFTVKISSQEGKLKELENSIASVGTAQQKETEKEVFKYQKKINDFTVLLAKHKIPTNILKFFEKMTLPNIWFNGFAISSDSSKIQLSGEAEDLITLSRQLFALEGSKFVKDIAELSFEPAETGRTKFNTSFFVDPSIFLEANIEDMIPSEGILETVSPSADSFIRYYIL